MMLWILVYPKVFIFSSPFLLHLKAFSFSILVKLVLYLIIKDHNEAHTEVFKTVHAFWQVVIRARALGINNKFHKPTYI